MGVAHRRTNSSEESLQANANRLKEYLSKLVVFGRSKNASSAADKSAVPSIGSSGPIMPLVKEIPTVEFVSVTDDMKNFSAYKTVRAELNNAKMIGYVRKWPKKNPKLKRSKRKVNMKGF